MWLVVGLGNPGSEYARTRHNVGFMILDELAERVSASAPKAKFGAEIREGKLGDERLVLCKPMEFMNVSGEAVNRVAGFWKVPANQVAVVYDDLDLPFGRLRLGAGGGSGGHNGLKSLIANLGSEFLRVRVGIGRPTTGQDGASYVLGTFSKDEQKELPIVITEAREAIEALLTQGLSPAMNRFNAKRPDPKAPALKPEAKPKAN